MARRSASALARLGEVLPHCMRKHQVLGMVEFSGVYAIISVVWPGATTWMTPAHMHINLHVLFTAG